MADKGRLWHDIFFTARDGLQLYARHYPAPGSRRRPVVCLAGLTRNSRDFHELAAHLSHPEIEPREVFALDYRGRGRSQWDPDWRNYTVPVEMLDVLDLMTTVQLHDAAIIGSSRGGLIAMMMAAAQPTTIGAVVLNDIGPVIEPNGLARIAGYVGRVPLPRDWAEAARLLADLNRAQFPRLTERHWEEIARQLYNEIDSRPAPGYDDKLSRALSVLDGPIPALWPQFAALTRVPLLVVRGGLSDLLSAQTVAEMRRRHADCATLTVPDQGHAPWLRDMPTMTAIRRFLAAADVGTPVASLAMA